MAFPPDITSATDQEILKSIQGHIHVRREGNLAHDDELYKHCMNVLEIRSMQRTAKATRRLVWATWGLVLATILLLLATILSIMNAPWLLHSPKRNLPTRARPKPSANPLAIHFPQTATAL